MLGQASNPMLEQAEQEIQQKMAPSLQGALEKVVHAGLTIMYSPQIEQQRNKQIAATTDPAKEAGEGAARLMSNLFKQSNEKMPLAVIMPAAMILSFEYLDLIGKAGKAQITPDLIAKATQSVASTILPLLGVSKEKLAQVIAQSQQGGPQAAQAAAAQPSAPAQAAPSGIINRAQGGM